MLIAGFTILSMMLHLHWDNRTAAMANFSACLFTSDIITLHKNPYYPYRNLWLNMTALLCVAPGFTAKGKGCCS